MTRETEPGGSPPPAPPPPQQPPPQQPPAGGDDGGNDHSLPHGPVTPTPGEQPGPGTQPGPGPGPAPTDSLDIGDDPEAGPEPTEDDYFGWELEFEEVTGPNPQPAASYGHPVPGTLIGFPGQGTHSFTSPPNNWQSDNAIDIWLYPGTAVVSPVHGVVSRTYGYGLMASGGRFAGYRLHVQHDDGKVTFYTHMRRLVAGRGQRVAPGDVLGWSGIANTVPHLHFAIQLPYNPVPWAKKVVNLQLHEGGTPPPTHLPHQTPDTAHPPQHGNVEQAWGHLHDRLKDAETRGVTAIGFAPTFLQAVKVNE